MAKAEDFSWVNNWGQYGDAVGGSTPDKKLKENAFFAPALVLKVQGKASYAETVSTGIVYLGHTVTPRHSDCFRDLGGTHWGGSPSKIL